MLIRSLWAPPNALTGERVKSCVETRDLADSILL